MGPALLALTMSALLIAELARKFPPFVNSKLPFYRVHCANLADAASPEAPPRYLRPRKMSHPGHELRRPAIVRERGGLELAPSEHQSRCHAVNGSVAVKQDSNSR